jgi:hypothetical protein
VAPLRPRAHHAQLLRQRAYARSLGLTSHPMCAACQPTLRRHPREGTRAMAPCGRPSLRKTVQTVAKKEAEFLPLVRSDLTHTMMDPIFVLTIARTYDFGLGRRRRRSASRCAGWPAEAGENKRRKGSKPRIWRPAEAWLALPAGRRWRLRIVRAFFFHSRRDSLQVSRSRP